MKKLLLLGTAREGSTRVKNKMTTPIHLDTTLFDLYCEKLKYLQEKYAHLFSDVVMAIYPEDKILYEKAMEKGLTIIKRSKESVTGLKKRSEELHFLKDRKEDYIMWINGCLPMLRVETIVKAAKKFLEDDTIKSMTSVKERRNWFWDKECKAINNIDPTNVSTQKSPLIYETLHAFHIFNRKHLLKTDSYWNLKENDPYLYIFKNEMEFLDVDTEIDLFKLKALLNYDETKNNS